MTSKSEQNTYQIQLQAKERRLSDLLASFGVSDIEVFKSSGSHYRMRAEFRVWHEGNKTSYIMFDKATKAKYAVAELPAACLLINAAMPIVLEHVEKHPVLREKLFQIDYLASTTEQLVISMLYHRQLEDDWEVSAQHLMDVLSHLGKISVIGRARKQKRVVGDDFVIEEFNISGKAYRFKQVENSFTQPNAEINTKMVQWAVDKTQHYHGDLLELYCGAGNFSIPLSQNFNKVLATEISKSSVSAAQYNIEINGINNLNIIRLSSEEFTQAYSGKREFYRLRHTNIKDYLFTTVLVDPPRAGLDDDTINLISKFENIIYISCNPATLAENIGKLCKTHKVIDCALFDQFPHTEHIETGVILVKKAT